MNKVLRATSRGQVTLPKVWRDKFNTDYFYVEIDSDSLVIKPLRQKGAFEDAIESSWNEYKSGKIISSSDLMKKYGL